MQANETATGEAAVATKNSTLYEVLNVPFPKFFAHYDEYIFALIFIGFFAARKILTGKAFTPYESKGYRRFVERVSTSVLPSDIIIDDRLKPILIAGLYYSVTLLLFLTGFVLLAETGNTNHSYALSFSASLLQDLFFFGIVGVALTYLTMRNPGTAHPEERIGYLLNSPMVSDTVRRAVFDSVAPNLIYCKKLHIKVNFVEYCEDIDAFRVEILSTSLFFNTINDQVIKDEKNLFILETDRLKIDPSKHEGFETNGAITGLKFRFASNDQYRDEIVSDIKVDKKYEHPVSIYCDGGTSYESVYSYWVWHKIGREHFWRTKRFVDEFTLQMKNETNFDIRFKCLIEHEGSIKKQKPQEEILTPNDRKEYTFTQMKPNHHRLFKLIGAERKK